MREKRKVERFDLQIDTLWNVQNIETVENPMLVTRDISSTGAFLTTTDPLPVGTDIELNFLLSPQELSNGTKNRKVTIRTFGKVIRTDEEGMAVQFEKFHKISQLKH
jgi:PilZ domain